ncbi:2'-5' RNA ligase family protein [Candidatus Nomurabacteria bacterium]|nr:2'-5' RNA ligase family protein [Candidatus Nomurabacteria bacterium]
MNSLQKQKEFYNELWKQNSKILGKNDGWVSDPIPLYTIGIWLHKDLHDEMGKLIRMWQEIVPAGNHLWLPVDQLHISLDIPGRLDTHFQEDDILKMVDLLQVVCRENHSFEITLGNISCFPAVPFREVYDEAGSIFKLHNAIADKIPWSLHSQFRYKNYHPHMSIFYPGEDVTDLIKHKEFSRELKPVQMTVKSIYLTKWYDGEGVLERSDVATIELGSGKLLGKISEINANKRKCS